MPEVTLRELTPDTWAEAVKLQVADEQANYVATNLESIAWSRYEPDLTPVGVYAVDEMVGFILYGKWPEEPHRWGVARIMIDKHHQGKGYGKAAMQAVIDLVRERDPLAIGLKLAYVPGNEVARSMYRSLGFRETGEYMGDELVTALDFPPAAEKEQPTRTAEPAEVRIEPLTIKNWHDAVNLSVADDQADFVSTNLDSIALSRFRPEWIPTGIFAGSRMVGFALYGPVPDAPDHWHITRFMIDKHYQGKGYGKAALRLILDDIRARATNLSMLDLSVAPENAAAIHVYESLGFVKTDKIRNREMYMELDVYNRAAVASS